MKGYRDQFCRCHKPAHPEIEPPLPEKQKDGNGKVVAVLCKHCTRTIACTCTGCGEWVAKMFDHVETCRPKAPPRAKKVAAGNWLPGVKV